MKYLEAAPTAHLSAFVKCYWSLEQAKAATLGAPEPVVPDGSMEIIFNLSDRFRRFHTDGAVETQPASLVAGQIRTKVTIAPSGNVRLFGIRFTPAGAHPFFRFSLSEMADRIESLDSVWGCGAHSIEDRIFEAESFIERTRIIEAVLTERLSVRPNNDRLLSIAVAVISQNRGSAAIAMVAREMSLSERALERQFKEKIGLSPKIFSRIVRFQSVLKALELNPASDLIDMALTYGYYDQSHMINEFRHFSGTSPTVFLENAHRMTELFTTGE